MMRRDLNDDMAARSQQQRVTAVIRRLRRTRVRAKARPARSSATNNMLASFGMIVGLLMIWAMTVSM